MRMENNFIVTTDKKSADYLRKSGFQEIKSGNNNVYTFLNTDKLQFSDDDIDKTKIQYTNMLCI